MRKDDAHWLAERLNELSEVLGGRQIGPKAIQVWIDALGECSSDDVRAALSDWPKRATKSPAPAEILKVCRERMSARIETDTARHKADGGKALGPIYRHADTAVAREALTQIKEILRGSRGGYIAGRFRHIGGADIDPKDWARVLQVRHESGEQLSLIQIVSYREALHV